jgi:site-specific recombinase XerD
MSDYDREVEAIRTYNQPLLEAFQAWLEESGLSEKTVRSHVENIDFFTKYLVYYEPLNRLDQATDSDVFSFLSDWFPRKAMWASVSSVRSYLASFKKFFMWMGEAGHVSQETVAEVIEVLKEGREEFIDAVDGDSAYW